MSLTALAAASEASRRRAAAAQPAPGPRIRRPLINSEKVASLAVAAFVLLQVRESCLFDDDV